MINNIFVKNLLPLYNEICAHRSASIHRSCQDIGEEFSDHGAGVIKG